MSTTAPTYQVGVLGSGQVAQVLAKGFAGAGHSVRIASREGNKLAEFSASSGIAEGTFASVAGWANLIVLAVKGTVAESVAASIAAQAAGKILIDVNNPIADAPPEDGILRYFTGPNDSLLERVQAAAPEARCVKAWSCVGNAFMIHPQFPGGRPTMFICGNDAAAKQAVAAILDGFGWDSEDIGSAKGARAIEPLCQLWCAPGMLRGQWAHAFKLLKM
ncbi:MAG: NAD(P)-binding domain-containing protein [Deltaproteobacteria bacterium]|nr:NAD(P)-binding domain-containing protein [Deltaproteobacteria bacterium]